MSYEERKQNEKEAADRAINNLSLFDDKIVKELEAQDINLKDWDF